MKRILTSILIITAVIVMFGCNQAIVEDTTKSADLVTTSDTISYLIGVDISRSLKSIKEDIIPEIVFSGIKDGLSGEKSRFPADQERIIMQAFSEKMRQKTMAKSDEKSKKNIAEEKAFLEENGKKEGVVTTKSGLQYTVLKKGDGPIPTDSSKVKVHYEGKLLSGKVFDSSYKRGKPTTFGVKQVIKGWTEVLLMMKVGSKYKIFVPSELAYGKRGMPHDIGPSMMLTFEIELLGIEK